MKRLFAAVLIFFVLASGCFAGSQDTSSTLASTIITNVRSYLAEDTPGYWSDTELLKWINDGTLDTVLRSRCLEATENIDLLASTIEYSITSDYVAVSAVTYRDSTGKIVGLEKGKPEDIAHSRETVPQWWYEWNGKIGIYPSLSSVTTERVTVYYVSRPSTVTSAQTVLVPAIYDRALIYYVVAQALLKDRKFASAAQFTGLYHAEIDRFRVDFKKAETE